MNSSAPTTKRLIGKGWLGSALLLSLLVSPSMAFAAEFGFPTPSVWVSKESLIAGETVSVYTVLVNTSDATFSGMLEFQDNGTVIGSAPFTITPPERSKTVMIDWIATAGDHAITAHIIEARLVTPAGSTVVAPTATRTETRTLTVAIPAPVVVASATASTTAERLGSTVDQYVPEPVKEAAVPVVAALEQVRAGGADMVTKLSEENRERINELRGRPAATSRSAVLGVASSTASTTTVASKKSSLPPRIETPFRYVYWGLLTLAGYLFTITMLYYAIVAILAVWIMRGIVRFIRRRRAI